MPTPRKTPRSQRETISAAVPRWKKSQVEAIRDQRRDRSTSATVEYALDLLRGQYGYPDQPTEDEDESLPKAA